MLISLHENANTTPAIRLALQQSGALAQQYGIGLRAVRKWRHRTDESHTAHHLQTTLNATQEELVIYLRSQLLLPLDDLLAVVHEFEPLGAGSIAASPRAFAPELAIYVCTDSPCQ